MTFLAAIRPAPSYEPEPCAASFEYAFDAEEMFGGFIVVGNGIVAPVTKNSRTGAWEVDGVDIFVRKRVKSSDGSYADEDTRLFSAMPRNSAWAISNVVEAWVESAEGQATIQRAAEADEERRVADHEDEPDGRGE